VAENLWRLYYDTIIARPSDAQIMIALLHDVVEDTEITAQDLYNHGFSQHVVEGVKILTKSADSGSYDKRIQTIIDSGHRDAMWVKLCDLMDNLHPHRRTLMQAHDAHRAQRLYDKYAPALNRLSAALGVNSQNVWHCIGKARYDQPVVRP
jgi:(p)ppGpp synthase/HD superfamily hydrolase